MIREAALFRRSLLASYPAASLSAKLRHWPRLETGGLTFLEHPWWLLHTSASSSDASEEVPPGTFSGQIKQKGGKADKTISITGKDSRSYKLHVEKTSRGWVPGPSTSFGAADSFPQQRNLLQRTLRRAKHVVQATFLPAGYPNTVGPLYINYSMWSAITNVAVSANTVLASTFMLYAVGLGSGAVPTAGALNWILKDGIGQLGTLLFGKAIAHNFDVHSKSWYFLSMVQLKIATGVELLTMMAPQHFLLLGSLANAIKGTAWMASGSTRSVFNLSFAVDNNLADVTAKGTSQYIFATFLGTAAGATYCANIGQNLEMALAAYGALSMVTLHASFATVKNIPLPTLNSTRLQLVAEAFLTSITHNPNAASMNDAREDAYEDELPPSPFEHSHWAAGGSGLAGSSVPGSSAGGSNGISSYGDDLGFGTSSSGHGSSASYYSHEHVLDGGSGGVSGTNLSSAPESVSDPFAYIPKALRPDHAEEEEDDDDDDDEGWGQRRGTGGQLHGETSASSTVGPPTQIGTHRRGGPLGSSSSSGGGGSTGHGGSAHGGSSPVGDFGGASGEFPGNSGGGRGIASSRAASSPRKPQCAADRCYVNPHLQYDQVFDDSLEPKVPTPAELAAVDPPLPRLMGDERLLDPAIHVGTCIEQVVDGDPDLLVMLLTTFKFSSYIISARGAGIHIILREDADARDIVQAFLQAVILRKRIKEGSLDTHTARSADLRIALQDTLLTAERLTTVFMTALTAAGWRLQRVVVEANRRRATW